MQRKLAAGGEVPASITARSQSSVSCPDAVSTRSDLTRRLPRVPCAAAIAAPCRMRRPWARNSATKASGSQAAGGIGTAATATPLSARSSAAAAPCGIPVKTTARLPGADPVMPEHPVESRGRHDAGQVVVAEDQRLVLRARRDDHLRGADAAKQVTLKHRDEVVRESAVAGRPHGSHRSAPRRFQARNQPGRPRPQPAPPGRPPPCPPVRRPPPERRNEGSACGNPPGGRAVSMQPRPADLRISGSQ